MLSLIALVLLAASWLQPLHILPWVSWHSEVLVFFGVLMLALGVTLVRRGTTANTSGIIALPVSILLWPGLALLVFLQWLAGQISYGGDALVLGLYFALAAFAWGLGHAAGRPDRLAKVQRLEEVLEPLAWTLLVGAVASVVIAMVQAFDVWPNASWVSRMTELRRPGSNLGQPNQLATLLLMGLASLILLVQIQRLGHLSAVLIYLSLAIGMAATESRTGVLSMTMLMVWSLVGMRRMRLTIPLWVLIAAYAVFLLLYLGWPAWMSAGGQYASNAQINTQAGMRLVVWPQLLEAMSLRPWAGWGLREVSAAHNAVVSGYALSEPYTYAHNVVLDLVIGAGAPLAMLVLGLSGAWLWRRLRGCISVGHWYCVAATLPVAVHAMLEFPHAYAYFLAPVMFLLGALESATGGKALLHLRAGIAGLIVALVSAVAMSTVLEYIKVEEDFRVVRFESLRLGKTPEDHVKPDPLLLTQLGGLLNAGRIKPEPLMAPELIETARKAAMRYPWPATQNRYALSLALNGRGAEASRQLQVIRAMHGEKTYEVIRASWQSLAEEKYPTLREIGLP